MVLAIIGIGIVMNFICLGIATNDDPNGAMGMQIGILLCFIPYFLPIVFCISKIADYFGWGK